MELVWDPAAGCADSMVAERRAKAFTAGTVKAGVAGGHGDDAARFYAAEAAKVIQAFFHAAALTGRTLDHVLRWVANPAIASEPTEILREHPHAAPYWHGLLQGALHGDDRTAGNTTTTVHHAVLADQRRRAGHAFTSDALEEWHRYSLPAFTERMKSRLRNHCVDGHQAWPAKGRHTRSTAEINRRTREDHYAADVGSLRPTEAKGRRRLRLWLVDLDTGEINDRRVRRSL